MKRNPLTYLLILLALVLVVPVTMAGLTAQGGAPTLVNYQGYLTDSSNQSLDGITAVRFELYAAASGGSPLWQETHNNVTVSEGYFSVMLGSVTPLTAANFSEATRYLQLNVDSGDGFQALPRQQLAAVPYALQALEAKNAWALGGNSDTTPGSHYVGTSDNQAVELHVNGARALRLEPGVTSPNLIGGPSGNIVSPGVVGATIGGGGHDGFPNSVTGNYGIVGGGYGNTADGFSATVGGGEDNTAEYYSTVGGGSGNAASSVAATVGGGTNNTANGFSATVGGGEDNTAEYYSTVGGGTNNTASGGYATVSGGTNNTASNYFSTVPGGRSATASHYGEMAYASGAFSASGDAQTSLYVLRQETSNATLTELFLDGASRRITLATNRVLAFDILIVGSHRFGGSSGGYQITGVLRNIDGSTSFVGTPTITILAESTASWDVQVMADNTNDALLINVQGASATTIRWVATVRTIEVGR